LQIIGIAGGSGSGKTTFAHKILSNVPHKVSLLHMDSYYLPTIPSELITKSGKPNYDHPKAFDWELLYAHLETLKAGQNIEVPIYDFNTNSRTKYTKTIEPTEVVIFEGIFSLYNQDIRNYLDIMCFLYVESDIRFSRRLNRDVKERNRTLDSVIKQYYETVRPMYQKYLAPQKDYAHFIVGEETCKAADILASKIKDIIKNDSHQTIKMPNDKLMIESELNLSAENLI